MKDQRFSEIRTFDDCPTEKDRRFSEIRTFDFSLTTSRRRHRRYRESRLPRRCRRRPSLCSCVGSCQLLIVLVKLKEKISPT
jgi:hypothetical protein